MDAKDKTRPADSKAPFTGAVMPQRAEDCGMEEAGNWGLLKEPQHAAPRTPREVPTRPSFYGE